jgi:hypothetical protein
MFKSVSKKSPRSESSAVATAPKPKPRPAGRDKLRYLDGELAKANAAALEIEQRIQRLGSIIAEAEVAHQNLQVAIVVDGGKSLSAYSAGQETDDSEIGKLVVLADNSARAKAAAQAALPAAQADLQNVREQAIKLNEARVAELDRVISQLADVEAREYEKAFREMCRLHDRLCGYASIQEMNVGDIRRIQDPLKAPRFSTPSFGDSLSDPFLRHQVNDLTVNEAQRMWSSVKQRLEADSDADVSDLI